MKISQEWLNKYIDVEQIDIDELSESITRAGIEVDDMISYDQEITKLVVGYVESIEKHPEADKLNICQVNVGEETVQIVCGAPNIDKGQYVIVSRVGGRLPGGMKIKRAKLRGQVSEGMICSLQEIGIPSNVVPKQYEEGIYIFKEEVTPGTDALTALYLNDHVIEFDLTPNRSDALSVIGTAYEVGTLYERNVKLPEDSFDESSVKNELIIEIEDTNLAPYYSARIVRNIEVKESPLWMQSRLMKAGIRPINNIVDISNYVMLEYGQPLHMFDLDKVASNRILVRQAKENEEITTLDGQLRMLRSEDIVITDGQKPIALAGVMGGLDTEVSETTKNIIIESAKFDPTQVRKTSNHFNLRSDSSLRFEKDSAEQYIVKALNRAAHLATQLANGEVLKDIQDAGELNMNPKEVVVSSQYINDRLGLELSTDEIIHTLSKLGFDIHANGDKITVFVPTRRNDITMKADILEEVARIYGYDALPATLPDTVSSSGGGLSSRQKKIRQIKSSLQGIGYVETINYALTDEAHLQRFNGESQRQVKLLMPMSQERSVLRQSLIPHLIQNVQHNNARQMQDVKLYECGTVFFSQGNSDILPEEVEYLSMILTGVNHSEHFSRTRQPVNFYDAKGATETIAKLFNVEFKYIRSTVDGMHPGQSADVYYGEQYLGFVGRLHPTVEKKYDLKETYVAELNLTFLLEIVIGSVKYEPLAKFPSVRRDLAIEMNRDEEIQNVLDKIEQAKTKYLKDVLIFDVYQGEHIDETLQSVSIALTFINKEETLTEEAIQHDYQSIIDQLNEAGYQLRG